jgi:ATP-dependent DNA ligase
MFMVFDAPRAKGTFSARIRVARNALKGCGWARVVTQVRCASREQVNSMLETVMQGGEGLMLRHPTAEYKGGRPAARRSTDLLKH